MGMKIHDRAAVFDTLNKQNLEVPNCRYQYHNQSDNWKVNQLVRVKLFFIYEVCCSFFNWVIIVVFWHSVHYQNPYGTMGCMTNSCLEWLLSNGV
jgi:hypothetical protein